MKHQIFRTFSLIAIGASFACSLASPAAFADPHDKKPGDDKGKSQPKIVVKVGTVTKSPDPPKSSSGPDSKKGKGGGQNGNNQNGSGQH